MPSLPASECLVLILLIGVALAADQANSVCGKNKFRYRRPRPLEDDEIPEGRIIGGLEAKKGEWPWQERKNRKRFYFMANITGITALLSKRFVVVHPDDIKNYPLPSTKVNTLNSKTKKLPRNRVVSVKMEIQSTRQVSIQLAHPYWGFIGHWCGGVLIDSMWVITGAHCLVNRLFKYPYPSLWTVVAGEHNLRERDANEQAINVEKIVVHNLFTEYHNDVALLKLARPVLFGRGVAPICLPASNTTRKMKLEGLRCMATGWGQIIQGQQNSATLQRVEMPVVTSNICKKAYESKYNIPIKKYHVCAGNVEKGSKGTCVGDSGGPLQCPIHQGRWYLIGVTSFGSGCVKPGFPDVFTRISYYIDWIHESIQKYSREKKKVV